MSAEKAISIENLGRIYKIRGAKKNDSKEITALSHINLTIERGELFGLLGPNGAGKTTLIKILTTLLAPSSGSAKVAGFDVVSQADQIRQRINMVSGGETSGYGLLTVRENLWMFSQFYGIPTKVANERIQRLLEIVGMADRANTKNSDLSTGLRQKMNIVRGFMTDPEILFLDEPTLGLDVGASRDVRSFIRSWVDEDYHRTLLLTTHYMVEADELCNRVAIINKGRVLACDSPAALKHNLRRESIFNLELDAPPGSDFTGLSALPGVVRSDSIQQDGYVQLDMVLQEESVLGSVIAQFNDQGIKLRSLQKREPTLEDVFVELVGARMEEVEDAGPSEN